MDLNENDSNNVKKKISQKYLRPPIPTKQYLISPPASPPVGWEPCEESTPILNYDLLHAINKLAPGQAHELHPQSEKHPAIVVHICEDDDKNLNKNKSSLDTEDEDSDTSIDSSSKLPKIEIQPMRAPESFIKSSSQNQNL